MVANETGAEFTHVADSYDVPMPFYEISDKFDDMMLAPIGMKDGSHKSALELADRAYQHRWFGHQIKTQPPRFGFYFDADSPVSDYLGNDADTIGHMYELPYHAAMILRAHPEIELTEEEIGIFMFALMGHDMDETTHDQIRHTCGGVTGDIQCGKKTPEQKALQKNIREMRDKWLYADVPERILRRVEALVAHEDETILGELFEAAHEYQSYLTTRIAEETLDRDAHPYHDHEGIEYIATQVRTDTLEKLRPHFARFARLKEEVESYDVKAA